jgi:hypothetical protein
MRCANLLLTGAKPIVQCVSSSLLILPQEVKVKTSYADALSICGQQLAHPSGLNLEVAVVLLDPGNAVAHQVCENLDATAVQEPVRGERVAVGVGDHLAVGQFQLRPKPFQHQGDAAVRPGAAVPVPEQ